MNRVKRALLVDDYIFSRGILRRCLSELSTEVEEADHGDAAWAILESSYSQGIIFDIIFSDLEMPNMDGFKLLQKCKADPRFASIPFVIVTGQKESSIVRKIIDLGALDYFFKPLVLEDCRTRVQAIMNKIS